MEAVVTTYQLIVNGKKYIVEVGDVSTSPVKVIVNGESKLVEFTEVSETTTVSPTTEPAVQAIPQAEPAIKPAMRGEAKVVTAPMPGKIMSIRVKAGDKVVEGDTICTLEAMKMEMPISSTASGVIQDVHVNVGDNVGYNDPLVTVA